MAINAASVSVSSREMSGTRFCAGGDGGGNGGDGGGGGDGEGGGDGDGDGGGDGGGGTAGSNRWKGRCTSSRCNASSM